MNLNKWIIALIVLILLAGAGFWWWKSPVSDKAKEKAVDRVMPTIGVASVNITNIDAEKINLLSKITLFNPLPVDINTKKLNYTIYIDSVKVIEDAYENPIIIRSSDSSQISLPMEILAKPMVQVLKYFDDHKIDSANYSVRASFEVDVPIAGERKFIMNVNKKLPAFRIPKIKIKHVDLNALALKSKGMDIEVEVFNPNMFPLEMIDGKFEFAVEDALHLSGMLEKFIKIPAKGSQNVSIHTRITDGNMLKTGWKMLTDKKDTEFVCKFNGKLDSENKLLSKSKMSTTITGTLDEIMNIVKKAD
ncbi:LEA type 2 family protein [Dyadobacter sp. CY345]|uniref:NDR1/HIN1-like protein n=1 Tax=Dyadobacter sp. CY345 TaxID=2909335 RepID=UPI001F217D72|nr:LEA type 2 family protein [Dyadobacter sp. CY345]MCF2446716.1 LEA type 2 family protein [Dyadobacter sp. CY345]